MVLLGAYSWLNTLFAAVYAQYGIKVEWYYGLLAVLLMTCGVWEMNRLTEPIVQKHFPMKSGWVFLAAFLLTGAVLSVICAAFVVILLGFIMLKLPAAELEFPLRLSVMYSTRVNLFMHTLNAIFFFLDAYRRKELEAESLKRINAQAQLQSIRNQLNPHFLFNNLNVLSTLVIKDNPEANQFIEAFAKVYRHLLNTQDKDLVTVSSELSFIEPYVFLLKKRFQSALSVSIYIPEEMLHYKLVPGALQLLVENAIKHNVASKQDPLVIDITVNGHDKIVVSNNLQKKKEVEVSTRFGLKNIQQRYELIGGGRIVVKQDNLIFSVSLPLLN